MRKVNLKIQMHQIVTKKLNAGYGISRHKIKKALKNHHEKTNERVKDNSIHSFKTAQSYRQTIDEFSTWLKQKHQEIWDTKDIASINKDIAYEYLKEREERGLSAWTISKDLSALNKVLELELTKKEGNLQYRNTENITRSREDCKHDKSYNEKNYKDQIEFAKAFGLRRESIHGGQYQVKDISLFIKDNKLYAAVIEKGGRYREAECLKLQQEQIIQRYNVQERESLTKEQFKELYNQSSKLLFDKYTSKIDNHAFRSEYANNLYKQLLQEKISHGKDIKQDYSYKGKFYDSEILMKVSANLGHSRLSVVVYNYLR